MTTAELQDMERLVHWALKRWWERTDYDDLRQEARIGAWKAWEKCRESGCEMSTIVVKAARYAALEWMRSTKSDAPHYGWRGAARRPLVVSMEEMAEQMNHRSAALGRSEDCDGGLPDPDFAPELLEQLAARLAWIQAIGTVTPRQAAMLRAVYRQGWSKTGFAAHTGRHWSAISQLHAGALQRCRQKLPAEEQE